jgi:hypothetical protein
MESVCSQTIASSETGDSCCGAPECRVHVSLQPSAPNLQQIRGKAGDSVRRAEYGEQLLEVRMSVRYQLMGPA